jgi:UTP:GlnB (protein PII) uridylyltransferase
MDASQAATEHLARIAKERKALEKKMRRLDESSRLWAYVAEHGEAPPEIGYDPDEADDPDPLG